MSDIAASYCVTIDSEAAYVALASQIPALGNALLLVRHWSPRGHVLQLLQPIAPPKHPRDVMPAAYAGILRVRVPAGAPDALYSALWHLLASKARVVATDPRSTYRKGRVRGDRQIPLSEYVLAEIRDGALPNRKAWIERTRNWARWARLRDATGKRPPRPGLLDERPDGFA